jgi:hypothetical protein
MAAKSPFLVDVRDLPCTRELSLDGAFVGAAVAGMPMREALEAPVDQAGEGQASLSLYSEGTHVFASGHIRGTVRVACSRCVEPVRARHRPRSAPGHVHAARPSMPDDTDAGPPAAAATAPTTRAADGGAEIGAGDLDLFPYDGETVDLEPLHPRAAGPGRAVRPAVPGGLPGPVPAVRHRPQPRTVRSASGRSTPALPPSPA